MSFRLSILGSTRGTDLLALIQAIRENRLAASIELVISNKADALILERAKSHQLDTFYLDPRDSSRENYDNQISDKLRAYKIDLIVLIGYMRILSANFVKAWKNRIINVHPSLLPAFAGGMDKNIHQAVLEAGMKETGCTVHYVTEEVDKGPILVQKKCAVSPQDNAESLKERVQALEGEALIEAISMVKRTYESK